MCHYETIIFNRINTEVTRLLGRLEQYNHLGAKKFTEAGGYSQLKYYHDGLDWVQKLIKAGVTTYNPQTIDDMFHEEMY